MITHCISEYLDKKISRLSVEYNSVDDVVIRWTVKIVSVKCFVHFLLLQVFF